MTIRIRRRAARVLLVSVLVVVPARRAGAETSSSELRARAKQLAVEQTRLEQAAEALNEKMKRSQEVATSLDQQVADARQSLAHLQARDGDLQRRLAQFAVSSYTNGRLGAGIDILVSGGAADDIGLRRGYAPVVLGDQTDLLDTFRSATADTAQAARQLDAKLAAHRTLAATITKQRTQLTEARARLDASAARVQGDLARAVESERTALLAEQERRAAARQRTAQEAAARNRPTPTSTATRRTTPASTATPRSSDLPAPTPARPASLPPAPSAAAGIAVNEALRQLGKPYVFGTNGPDTFDCSGLTQWAWAKAGISMPHYTVSQFNAYPHVSLDQLQPGDLVFFNVDLGHMGMYIGNGQIVQAPRTGEVVKVTPINPRTVVGAARPG